MEHCCFSSHVPKFPFFWCVILCCSWSQDMVKTHALEVWLFLWAVQVGGWDSSSENISHLDWNFNLAFINLTRSWIKYNLMNKLHQCYLDTVSCFSGEIEKINVSYLVCIYPFPLLVVFFWLFTVPSYVWSS